MTATAHFAPTYALARARFLDTARHNGYAVVHHVHPGVRGAEGEELAIDLAIIGDVQAPNLFFCTSGTHGAEGFCGSGAEIALMSDAAFGASLRAANACAVLLHALNPYGFSHLRRTNEDNIDLNRNFRDFQTPPAPNAAYAEVHGFLIVDQWPPTQENQAKMGAYIARHGAEALQQAITGGQCEYPDGLFFGGVAPAWSNTILREVFAEYGAARQRIAWIDFHTGLGPWGHGEKIYNGRDVASDIARAKACWGQDVTSFFDGTSTSAKLTGVNHNAVYDSCPGVEYAGIALEYGTLPLPEIFMALRADQWLSNHPDVDAHTRATIKRQVRDAFYGDRDDWKQMIVDQAWTATRQALAHLAR
jgi:hypothetical protein